MSFQKLGIQKELEVKIFRKGIKYPTEIQYKAIPEILQGKDIIGKAKTGTGKTFAFLFPIVQQIDYKKDEIQAIVLVPTRELATQISREFKNFLENTEDCILILGGQDINKQIKKLGKLPKILVGTPGRINELVIKGNINLGKVEKIILDEADQILDMGFSRDVDNIINKIPKRRQTLLFSATIPDEVKIIAKKYMKNPKQIFIEDKKVIIDNIEQKYIKTTDRRKIKDLMDILDDEQPFLAIIFCRTKKRAEKLNMDLGMKGYNCDVLNGDMSQAKRQRVMKNFRNMKLQYLIATDIAARGLDINGITHIFNYDIPEDTTTYIHRIGRTGRAGDKGKAYTFVTEKNEEQFKKIESRIKKTIEEY